MADLEEKKAGLLAPAVLDVVPMMVDRSRRRNDDDDDDDDDGTRQSATKLLLPALLLSLRQKVRSLLQYPFMARIYRCACDRLDGGPKVERIDGRLLLVQFRLLS
jgi:hypothetical protein